MITTLTAWRTRLWPNGKLRAYPWLLYPALAFVITRLVVFFGAYLAEIALPSLSGDGFWHAVPDNIFLDVWARWDSGFYIKIIEEGYLFVVGQQSNVAFFPLYPLLVAAVDSFTENVVLAGIVVSHLSLLIALIFLYRLTYLEFGDHGTAQRSVFYIAAFPTAFFFSAVYTESTFLLFAVATLYFARRRLWAWAALMGLLTSITRIVGVVLWGVVMLEWMRVQGWTLSSMFRPQAWRNLFQGLRRDWISPVIISIIPLGLLSHMLFLYRTFQDPFAFKTVQSAWGRQNLGPVAIVLRDVQLLLEQSLLAGEIWWHVLLDVFALFFALVMAVLIWKRLGEGYALFCLLAMIIPATSGTGSLSRYILVLFPIFMMLAWWGRRPSLDRAITITFTMFLGIFTAIFVNWVFIA